MRLARLAAALLAASCLAADARAGLVERSFLPLASPPPNYIPASGPSDVACAVAARGDGLVAVAGWTRNSVFLIDARNPDAPRVICEQAMTVDIAGLAFEGDVLWVGGDDQDISSNGLLKVTLASDVFSGCPTNLNFTPGVSSGVTPNIFSVGGRNYAFIVNRWGFANHVVELGPRTVAGSWTPVDGDTVLSDAAVRVTATGQVLAVVAALKGGAYVLDLSNVTMPQVLAHWDWTFTAPDFDGDPGTADPCDRNGDGDALECGETGRNGDGRRLGFASAAAWAEVDGRLYVVTVDGNLAGGVRIWALADILATCPGESPANCPIDQALNNASGPPWPDVDVVPLAAGYQVAECPLAASGVHVEGTTLFVAYHEAGVHVIDLAAQGLPASAVGQTTIDMGALAIFDTLPGDSDTVLENFPCHPLGANDGCESQAADWNPTPCQASPPAGAAFRVVRNAGLRSATGVAWAGCHVYVADQGTPDADGLPAPSHDGTQPGLWILDFDALPDAVGASLRVMKDARDQSALTLSWAMAGGLAREHHVHRGLLPLSAPSAYSHECVASLAGETTTIVDQVGVSQPAGFYYLVSGACGETEGVLGWNSAGMEIAPGALPCP